MSIPPSPRRARRILLVGCGVFAVVIATACLTYYVYAHSRFRVIGKVDPDTGYRIEYTVSKRYQKPAAIGTSYNQGSLEGWQYRKLPPSKAMQWFYETILRQPVSTRITSPRGPLYSIMEVTLRGTPPIKDRVTVDNDGSIHAVEKWFGSIVSEKHMSIGGFPADWCIANASNPGFPNQKVRWYVLFVKPKGKEIMYVFAGLDDRESPTGILGEMESIRDSIKITNALN